MIVNELKWSDAQAIVNERIKQLSTEEAPITAESLALSTGGDVTKISNFLEKGFTVTPDLLGKIAEELGLPAYAFQRQRTEVFKTEPNKARAVTAEIRSAHRFSVSGKGTPVQRD